MGCCLDHVPCRSVPRLRGAETDGDDPLAFSPICCLSGLRDVLHRLGALIRGAEEQTRQRAALAALDAVSMHT